MTDSIQPIETSGDIVARADFAYRWRVYVLSAMLIVFGLWCVRDGFFQWPDLNRRNNEIKNAGGTPTQASKSETDIRLNQWLGILLPAIGAITLGLRMYRSRGAYVLSGNTLKVPGQPPVELDQIESIDKTRWDRKGVAVVEYKPADGQSRTLTLEDMIYDRQATDRIVDRLERHLNPQAAATSPNSSGA
jgi:hypothetical protein